MKYILKYEWEEIAEVEIDHEKAAPTIRQMIEFYEGPDESATDEELRENWLKRLGLFILRNERGPIGVTTMGDAGDEGWADLGGTYGITLLSVTPYEFNSDQIDIEQAKEVA